MNEDKVQILFENHLFLVYKIAHRMKTYKVDQDDLIQSGLMGLYAAAKNYDDTKSSSFISYATYYILGEIRNELRRNQTIPINKELSRILRKLKQVNTHQSIFCLCEEIQCSRENLLIALTLQEEIFSLNETIHSVEVLQMIGNDETNSFEISLLNEALHHLNQSYQQLLYLKYWQKYTQEQLANYYHCSQSTISRMEKKAIFELKQFIKES